MKESIVCAAAALFSTKGYDRTSMEDIANAAGVAKGSIYYHFKNKSQLFCETVLWGFDFLENKIIGIKDSDFTIEEITERMIQAIVETFLENRPVVDMVMIEPSQEMDSEVLERMHSATEHFTDTISKIIREGINLREIRPVHPFGAAYASLRFIYEYCRYARELPPERIQEDIGAILMKGLLIK